MIAAAAGLSSRIRLPRIAQHAAGAVGVFGVQVGGDLGQAVAVADHPAERIAEGEGLDFTLLQRDRQQVGRKDLPGYVGQWVEAELGEADGKEVLIRRAQVGGADGLALQVFQRSDAAGLGCQQAHAAAVGGGGDADVESLLQRFQPAQRHADPGIGLAGGNRLQQLIGGTAEVDQLDVQVALFEKAFLHRDRNVDHADRGGVPGQFQGPLVRDHRDRHGRGSMADRRAGEAVGDGDAVAGENLRADQAQGRSCTGGPEQAAARQTCHGWLPFSASARDS